MRDVVALGRIGHVFFGELVLPSTVAGRFIRTLRRRLPRIDPRIVGDAALRVGALRGAWIHHGYGDAEGSGLIDGSGIGVPGIGDGTWSE